eukprot:360766-Chlamydomonas_euryale.AAC.8
MRGKRRRVLLSFSLAVVVLVLKAGREGRWLCKQHTWMQFLNIANDGGSSGMLTRVASNNLKLQLDVPRRKFVA